jgi:DNA modification methylase
MPPIPESYRSPKLSANGVCHSDTNGRVHTVNALDTQEVACTLYLGRSERLLPTLPSASVDAVVADPPYPHAPRSYGEWTEDEWFHLMHKVVPECMRVLKPTGSAMFILQPNSENLGKMRLWVWEFLLWAAKRYNLIQDVYWWNYTSMPEAHTNQAGLCRPSLKYCIWLGPPDCYRDQDGILWTESYGNAADRASRRCSGQREYPESGHHRKRETLTGAASAREVRPSGHCMDRKVAANASVGRGAQLKPCVSRTNNPSGHGRNDDITDSASRRGAQLRPCGYMVDNAAARMAVLSRGAVTPFNVIPLANNDYRYNDGAVTHGARTPLELARWWTRYICPPGGVVLDPFNGVATMGMASQMEGRRYIGIEKELRNYAISCYRLSKRVWSPGIPMPGKRGEVRGTKPIPPKGIARMEIPG